MNLNLKLLNTIAKPKLSHYTVSNLKNVIRTDRIHLSIWIRRVSVNVVRGIALTLTWQLLLLSDSRVKRLEN